MQRRCLSAANVASSSSSSTIASAAAPSRKSPLFKDFRIINATDCRFRKVAGAAQNIENVPSLKHDLDRVLFNPGVYQFRDPRSLIFNFPSALESITQPDEFDYQALNNFVTPSEDITLKQLAKESGAKYVGSTSSTTKILSQLHFLLSNWRPLDLRRFSTSFSAERNTFTIISRAPCSVYLRYDAETGLYSIDSDKSFGLGDDGNILSKLGQSMEKVFTLDPEEYKKLLKTEKEGDDSAQPKLADECYRYSLFDDLMMRAQLDCRDERLGGEGTFDLKTRAVMGVRMDIDRASTVGPTYQLKRSTGKYESYEREFYDLLRSAMLKYSLQARIGFMNGVFICYHNTAKIFGFQYVDLHEMDSFLHGRYSGILGQAEFKVSLKLLRKILQRLTYKFPKQSMYLHFHTQGGKTASDARMHVTAECCTEEEVDEVQNSREPLSRETKNFAAFNVTVNHLVNNAKVQRPNKLSPTDKWAVHFKIEEITSNPVSVITQIRAARRRALNKKHKANTKFLQMLDRLSDSGKKWLDMQNRRESRMKRSQETAYVGRKYESEREYREM